jgi:hypothetical protein
MSGSEHSALEHKDLESYAPYRMLFDRFPRGEQALRGITATNHEDTLFVTKVYSTAEGKMTFITVPKNAEQFADSLFMISIFRIIKGLGYEIKASTKEVPVKVLASSHSEWFAGYVNAWLDNGGQSAETGSSKYSKGYYSYQSQAVKARYGSQHLDHLKLSSDTPGSLLSKMETFTKEHWGLRAQISLLFKAIAPTTCAIPLRSFLRSAQDLQKRKIRKNLPFQNGGIFTPAEVSLMKHQSSAEIAVIDATKLRLNTRDEDLALNFDSVISDYRVAMRRLDERAKPIIALRAPVLFPKSKRKPDVIWSKKRLDEKLQLMADKDLPAFSPMQFDHRITKIREEYIVSINDISDLSYGTAFGVPEDISDELERVLREYCLLLRSRAE